jgi:hypothetical protein
MLNFPYGLMAVGNVRDEINLNAMTAINRIQRLAYTAENLATVEASGMAYTYDTNYIYVVLATPTTTSIELDGAYTVNDHGIEFFSGTTVAVAVETLYGENLKDKLRTDVLTISEQTLTTAQKNQVAANLGIARSTLRDVPFAVGVSDWTLSNGVYTANFLSDYITSSCKVILTYEPTLENARAYINAAKKTGGGGLTFTTSTIPVGTVTGTAYVFDNDDNKVPTLIENTVTPIANGGTGQSSLAGAQQALGITALNTQITPHAYTAYTIDTTKMTVGNASLTKCIIAGGICCLQVYSATFTSVGSNQSGFITGLPKAKCQMGAVCAGANVDNTAAINAAGTTFWIGDGGTALNGHIGGGDNTRGHWITLIYPIDE